MIYDLAHGAVALLVIDVQEEYFDASGPAYVPAAAAILSPVNALIAAFRTAAKPIVFVRHAHRPDGSDVGRMGDFTPEGTEDSFVEGTPRVAFHAGLAVTGDDIVVVKRRYSAFVGTDLEAVLHTLGVRSVVVTGLMTSFCCETTARDAHGRDFEVLFVSDANAGPDLEDLDGNAVGHEQVLTATVTALSAGFAEVVDTAELVRRLDGSV